MQRLLATMITATTWGNWLPGDLRGYVEGGHELPHNPHLLKFARSKLSGEPVTLSDQQHLLAFQSLIDAAARYDYQLFCVSVESWHLHWLIDHRADPVARMVGRLKTAMRKSLAIGRVWSEGYDSRFCFTMDEVEARANYIMRHRGYRPLPGGVVF